MAPAGAVSEFVVFSVWDLIIYSDGMGLGRRGKRRRGIVVLVFAPRQWDLLLARFLV